MAGVEDSDWLFEYIVQFLRSPSWIIPITDFIDENCIVFDSEEENKFAYSECHDRFKSFLDSLLSYQLEEIGVTEMQFVELVSKAQTSIAHKQLIEHILAADDFLTFKKMMVKRNMELEAEALKMIQSKKAALAEAAAVAPASEPVVEAIPVPADVESLVESQLAELELKREQAELEHALAVSLALENARMELTAAAEAAEATLSAIQSSAPSEAAVSAPSPAPAPVAPAAPAPVSAPVPVLDEIKSTGSSLPPLRKVSTNGLPALNKFTPLPKAPEREALVQKAVEVLEQPVASSSSSSSLSSSSSSSSAPAPALTSSSSVKVEPSDAELRARQEYLKKQRDMLMQKKKQEREKQLEDFKKDQSAKPASWKAAVPTSSSSSSSSPAAASPSVSAPASAAAPAEDDKKLAARLALAQKLKAEVLQEPGSSNQYSLDEQLRKVDDLRQKRLQKFENL